MHKLKLRRSKDSLHFDDTEIEYNIRSLNADSELINVSCKKDTKGQWLIDHVCKELNLVERDYFGLRYVDSEKQRHWLDPTKAVYRQLKHVTPMVLCFRVKFYPADIAKLKEEITRYFLFLQLRRDLHHGRLLCSPADANLLAAYIIQSEVGDYDPRDHQPGYIAKFKMLPKQTQKQEEKIAELHKTLTGQVPSDAESNFIKKASTLDTYGVDPHPVKDQKGNQMYLGVTHLGIVTFQGNKRTHLFKWPQINKIAFEGKMFIVHVTVSEGEENSLTFKRKKHACGFKCPTFSACKHLWKCAVEQQYFFTLAASQEAPKVTSGGGWFTRGSKFRFSGRCQKEVYAESASITREPPPFMRSVSNPQFVRSINKFRANTMPAKLRDKDRSIGEVVADTNHVQSLSFLAADMSADDTIEEGIPEESAVTVSETPYEPLDSPMREELPPLPLETSVGSMTAAVAEAPSDGLDQTDLDTQIAELQNELDRCRTESNHVSSSAPPALHAENHQGEMNHKAKPDGHHGNNTSPVNPVAASNPKQNSGPSCVRAVLFSTLFVFILMVVFGLIILESDLELPVLNDIQHLKEVRNFKENTYIPIKDSMAQKVGGWFKT